MKELLINLGLLFSKFISIVLCIYIYRDVPPYYEEPYPPYPSFVPPPMNDRPERNDCEIIVVSKALTEYAEYIEQKLKSKGLIVDLLFPNEDVPIGRVLANISSRGCLYAILVMPQNEEHRSLTLNILHGIPQGMLCWITFVKY
ncbi:nuclear receptor coactivator 5-related [Holotrichia oblita]|uniref:Nuclear receptor coactivator 5-related n=1 Tax=Holotrichia oblita TaxID=644536 RepID=A0ACB9TUI7_HOLOL|nr:nuclear receptor coactivator 5-related [Holotrichia oblita]